MRGPALVPAREAPSRDTRVAERQLSGEKGSPETFGGAEGLSRPLPTLCPERGAASALGCARPAAGLASSRGPPGFPSAPLRGSPCAPGSGSGTGRPGGSWLTEDVLAPPSGPGSHFTRDRLGPSPGLWLREGGQLALSRVKASRGSPANLGRRPLPAPTPEVRALIPLLLCPQFCSSPHLQPCRRCPVQRGHLVVSGTPTLPPGVSGFLPGTWLGLLAGMVDLAPRRR